MAGAPRYKVYSTENEYIGCVKHLEDAAILVSSRGKGATVRFSHSIKHTLWHEGFEDNDAGSSYDNAANVMSIREDSYMESVNHDTIKTSDNITLVWHDCKD